MKANIKAIVGSIGLLFAVNGPVGTVYAGPAYTESGYEAQGYGEPASRYEFGTVVESHPIMQIYRHKEPQQQCWDEPVTYQSRRKESATGTILGGIIGAAIGNGVGHGRDNKRIGAVAGAVLGASIGNDLSRKGRHGRTHQSVEQRCRTVYEEVEEERVVGYQVKYRYAGHTYTTETAQDPGNSIKLKVTVMPVE